MLSCTNLITSLAAILLLAHEEYFVTLSFVVACR